MIADGDYLAVLGEITTKDASGKPVPNAYCDVWRFKDGKMVELKASSSRSLAEACTGGLSAR